MNSIQLVLISGPGGAGRTTALHALEDSGFYCVDNLPVVLLPSFLEILSQRGDIARAALGIDVRDARFWSETPKAIAALRNAGHAPEVVFLDASDDVLVRRYKETRRIHPLDANGDLRGAIERERRLLQVISPYIQIRLDTSEFTPHQLRAWIGAHYQNGGTDMHIEVVSFGYKHGILSDADLVFDARFLKNPYFVPELSGLTGLDPAVSEYVFSDPDAEIFLGKIRSMLEFLVPRFKKEGKRYLTVGIGCTGGRHRSVALAQALCDCLRGELGCAAFHRDLAKK